MPNNPRLIFSSILFILVTINTLFAEQNISCRIDGEWIVASQGNDEDMQTVKVKVWGSTIVWSGFYQLDSDSEEEYVVVSRGVGSGPHYKIQIVDFQTNGILVWAYNSDGVPKIENGLVWLAKLPKGYIGAATKPIYERFKLFLGGLSKVEK